MRFAKKCETVAPAAGSKIFEEVRESVLHTHVIEDLRNKLRRSYDDNLKCSSDEICEKVRKRRSSCGVENFHRTFLCSEEVRESVLHTYVIEDLRNKLCRSNHDHLKCSSDEICEKVRKHRSSCGVGKFHRTFLCSEEVRESVLHTHVIEDNLKCSSDEICEKVRKH